MEYTVVVHQAEEGGVWVEVPALPGCYSQGESLEEALSNVGEAITLYLEVLRDEGHDAPNNADVVLPSQRRGIDVFHGGPTVMSQCCGNSNRIG